MLKYKTPGKIAPLAPKPQQPAALRLTGSQPSPHRELWTLTNWQKLIKLLVIPSTDTANGLSQVLVRQKEDPNNTLN